MPTSNNFAGIHIFGGAPPLPLETTGRVFYVGSTAVPGGVAGVDAAHLGDRPQQPYATIDFAIGQCTASRGDVIVVLPNHSETTTAEITCDIAGITIYGLGWGRSRPTVTSNFSSAGDTVAIDAANVWLHNIRLAASSASQNAQVDIAAADARITDCVIEQGASNLIGVSVASGGHRFHMKGDLFLGTAAGPDVAVNFETSASDDWIIEDCLFDYAGSTGIDLGVIRATADATTGGVIRNCVMVAVDTIAVDFNSSVSAQGDGIISNLHVVAGAGVTSIEDMLDLGGYSAIQVYATDTASQAGARIPITTAS